MAYEIPGLKLGTLLAAADLSDAQYRFVTITSGEIAQNDTAGALVDGVLQNHPGSGESATVVVLSGGLVSKVVAGAAIADGAEVMSDNEGRAVTATATNAKVGKALAAASAAGEIIPVLLGYRGQDAA